MDMKSEITQEAASLQCSISFPVKGVSIGMNLIHHRKHILLYPNIAGNQFFTERYSITKSSIAPMCFHLSWNEIMIDLPAERTQNGKQQNVNRRIPPGRNPGCGVARKPH
jgi:hypothetical protein